MALAIGGHTIQELKAKISTTEELSWRRFFLIYGPVGDRRLDEHFAYLRHVVLFGHAAAGHIKNSPTIEECRLKYDYRRHFPKDLASEVEMMLANQDAEVDRFVSQFRKR